MSNTFSQMVDHLRQDAQQSFQRRLLVLSGQRDWCLQQVGELTATVDTLWIGEQAPDNVESVLPRQAQRVLGRTLPQLVVDGWDGLNPNALGQASGALTGGGLMILLCPPLDSWPDYDDPEHKALAVAPYRTDQVGRRFIKRMIKLLIADAQTAIVQQGQPLPALSELSGDSAQQTIVQLDASQDKPTPGIDQQRAISAILNTARNRRQPLVMTADRGRGKSAALGMAAAQLIEQGNSILITASNYAAVEEVFAFARRSLTAPQSSAGLIRQGEGSLRYFEPEQMLKQSAEGTVLLVDEAASIPAPMLGQLLEQFSRVVFSTTIHGYEGTGRGFAVRFRQKLEQRTPRWRSINLKQPVRWAADDPVEALIYQVLLLDADAAGDQTVADVALEDIRYQALDRNQLVNDDSRLRQLFGLLVLAHYRTTPGDLRILLDSPNLRLWSAEANGQLLGCVMLADEGPLEAGLAEAVWAGERRPPGHLLPQTLVAQAGFLSAAPLSCARVMRIAVHPAIRRHKVGQQLLRHIEADARQRGLDYLGASFSASADLLPFWLQSDYQPVRVGLTRDAVSGNYAALLYLPLSEDGQRLLKQLRQRFSEQLPQLIFSQLADMERELLPLLLINTHQSAMNAQDWLDLKGFAYHNRNLDSTRYALRKLALLLFSEQKLPKDDRYQALLIEQLLAPDHLKEQQAGRKWLNQQLRELTAECLKLTGQG